MKLIIIQIFVFVEILTQFLIQMFIIVLQSLENFNYKQMNI